MRRIKGLGESWKVTVGDEMPHPGVRAVVFHCLSNTSVGWRVAEVPADRISGNEALEEVGDDDLQSLLAHSDPLDYVHEEHADPHHEIGDPPRPWP